MALAPKYSFARVILDTLKSTSYAMLSALLRAIGGADFVGCFTAPGLKRIMKPIVEILAAVPSVVIRFLILLCLAPLMGK
jgi:phosphate transport system permease protein